MFTLKLEKSSEASQSVYEVMFESIFIYGSIRERKGRAILVQEDYNINRLIEIGKPCESNRKIIRDEPAFELAKDTELKLSNKDIDFFVEYISETPWSAGKSARKALCVISVLEDIAGRIKDGSRVS